MGKQAPQIDTTADTSKRLGDLRRSVGGMSAAELDALTGRPSRLKHVFETPRVATIAGYEGAVKAYAAANKREHSVPDRPLASATQALLEQAVHLQLQIWKKQGIAVEMRAMASLHGALRDAGEPCVDALAP
jgi:hypothetical protein